MGGAIAVAGRLKRAGRRETALTRVRRVAALSSLFAREYLAALLLSVLLHAAVLFAALSRYQEARISVRSGLAGSVFEVTLARLGMPEGAKDVASSRGGARQEQAERTPVQKERRVRAAPAFPESVQFASGKREGAQQSAFQSNERAMIRQEAWKPSVSAVAGPGESGRSRMQRVSQGVPEGAADGTLGAGGGGGLASPVQVQGLAAPAYPYEARLRRQEGRVVYAIRVSAAGRIEDIELLRSSSYPLLDRAALEAIRRAVFVPARNGARPVASVKKLAFRFELDEARR